MCCSDRDKWKSNGAISDKYGGWGSTSSPGSLIFSRVRLAECCLALSCYRITPFLLTIAGHFSIKYSFTRSIVRGKGLLSQFVHVSTLQNERFRECSTGHTKMSFWDANQIWQYFMEIQSKRVTAFKFRIITKDAAFISSDQAIEKRYCIATLKQ